MFKDSNISQRRAGQRGESNTKFIMVLVVFAFIGYIVYSILPVYYKEQQLKHDVKEIVRIGAINGRDPKAVEKQCVQKIDAIDFPEPIKVKASKKADRITVLCEGTVPVSFLVYTYKYNIKVEESFDRGGY